jgi:hypothetical protein
MSKTLPTLPTGRQAAGRQMPNEYQNGSIFKNYQSPLMFVI